MNPIHENAKFYANKFLTAERELLAAIIEVDAAKVYLEFDYTYLTPYCVQELGLSPDIAANFVRIAHKSAEVPQLQEAVNEGLSISKAKVIASVITVENQDLWIEKAQTVTREILEREVANTKPMKLQPEKAKLKANNLVRLEFDVTDEQMKELRRAQDLVSAKLGRFVTLAETHAFMMSDFLKRQDPVKKADRAQARPPRGGSQKTIPAAIKHQVFKRDRGQCQALLKNGSKCKSTRWIHLHHIQPQAQGGGHVHENLTTLCAGHHRLHHHRH